VHEPRLTLQIPYDDKQYIKLSAQNHAPLRRRFNDEINITITTGIGAYQANSNDHKYLGKVDSLNIIFE
jgi:hypothetical protein